MQPHRLRLRRIGALLLAAVLAGGPSALALTGTARAELAIDITKGTVAPVPIAIADFTGTTVPDQTVGKQIARVITDNLERSGLFNPLERSRSPG